MDVRGVVLCLTRRARLGHRVALLDPITLADEKPAEVRQGRLLALCRANGDGQTVRGDLAREGHLARRWRSHARGVADRDVDPAMLPARVRVVPETEGAEHGPVGRPRPRERSWRSDQGGERHSRGDDCGLRCPVSEHTATVAGRREPVNALARSRYRVAR
jgi:hypothetical protein